MESMCEFHFKSLETLRPSILAVATNSIGIPSTTTRLKDVVFLVLKFIHSSLHFVSFGWNFSKEARVDQGVDGGLDVTVLVLAYCLRDGRIVDVFPEIVGRNIKLVDHHDGQPFGPKFCALGNPRRYNTPFWEAIMAKFNSFLTGRPDALQRRLIVLSWNSHLIAPLSTSRWLCRFARTKHLFFCQGLVSISDSTTSSSHIFRMNSLALEDA